MRRTFLALFVVSISVCLSNCSSDGSINLANSDWSTICGTTNRSKSELSFTETQMSYTFSAAGAATATNHPGCSALDYEVTFIYDYTVPEGSLLGNTFKDEFDDYRPIDVTLKEINLTPRSTAFVNDVNAATFCGEINWAKNKSKNLLKLSGATLGNCGDGVFLGGVGLLAVGAGQALPFYGKSYTSAGDQKLLKEGFKFYSSFAAVVWNDMEKQLSLAFAIPAERDGLTADKRAIDAIAGLTLDFVPPSSQ